MFRFTEGFVKTWTPVLVKTSQAPGKRRDIYRPRMHVVVHPNGRCVVSMAVKRKGESWREVIGKFPDNKVDKVQREVLNKRYRHWFLILEDETILPHDLDRREEKAHEAASDAAMDEASAAGRMSDLIDDYLKRHVRTLKTSWDIEKLYREWETDWDGTADTKDNPLWMGPHIRGTGGHLGILRTLLVSELNRQKLLDILRGIDAPINANRMRAQMKKLCSWAVENGWLTADPAHNLPKNKENKRHVVLSEKQITAIWPLLIPVLRFSLATGQRRSEVQNMKWTDLEDNVWTQSDTKSGVPQVLKLPAWTMGLLPAKESGIHVWQSNRKQRFEESSLSNNWRAAADKVGSDATLHDARRTVATQITMLTQSTEPADRVLNHAMAGITSRYVTYDFGDMKAKALQLWADKLEGLVS
jgi:integrase